MDGTLLDSSIGITNSVNFVRSSLGLKPVEMGLILKHINTPGENLAKRFYDLDGYDSQVKELFGKHYYEECVKHVVLYEDIKKMLKYLHTKAHLAIATNAYDIFAKKMVDFCGIGEYFDMIIGANNLNSSKPEPLMIKHILKILHTENRDALLIGDSQKDELAAKNANISFIFADWGYGEYTAKDAFICKDSTKLLEGIFTFFPDLKD